MAGTPTALPGDGDTGETDDDPAGVARTWADDRNGNTRPAGKERLIAQAAAAAALLEFAYIDKIKNGG